MARDAPSGNPSFPDDNTAPMMTTGILCSVFWRTAVAKKKLHKQCYFCGQVADGGVEHVPPRNLFPEKKDLPAESPDYRKELITVPSCRKHNEKMSDVDQVAC